MPTLNGVLKESDCLLSVDDFIFERCDLRLHDGLCRRLCRCHRGSDLGQ